MPGISSPEIVLLKIKQRLVDSKVFTDPQVALGLSEEPQPIVGGMFCRIDPGDFRLEDTPGMGRSGVIARSTIYVRIYARRDIDTPQQDTRAISQILAKATQAVNSLHFFFPEDDNGNALVIEPIRFLGYGRPIRYTKDRQYIYTSMPMEVALQVGLSATDEQICS